MSEEQENRIAELEAALNLTDSLVYIKDAEGRYTYVNLKVQELLGIPIEHILGKDDRHFFDPEIADVLRQGDRLVLEEGQRIEREERVAPRSAGEPRSYFTIKKPILDRKGRIIGLCGISTDFTEKRLIEERLKLWATSSEKAEIGIAISDAKSNRLLSVNPAFARTRGYSQEELVGKHVMTLFPADMFESVRKKIEEADTATHLAFESEHLCKDGRRFPVLVDLTCIKSADGAVANRIAFVHDIAKRKEFEAELKMRESRYRAVIETSADGFWIVDMTEGKLMEVNDVYVRLSGYSREELLSMHISDLEAIESSQQTFEHLVKIKHEGHDRFESAHRRKDGSIWPVEVVVAYWSEFDVAFVFLVDIGKRKMLEKELSKNRKAMEALQQRQVAEQTAAALAHELNQPLSAISSYSAASAILLGAENPDLHKVRLAIEESEKQALRAGESIRQLINLLNTETVHAEVFDLNLEILEILKLAKTEHDLQFNSGLSLAEGLSPIRSSRIHLQKALLNLLHNGVEAMHGHGVPPFATSISIRTEKCGDHAKVTVKDNGPGIRKKDIGRLFEPFFTTKNGGIGMGLALSRSLIEAHGGKLWVDPDERPGASFCLTLPFSTAAQVR